MAEVKAVKSLACAHINVGTEIHRREFLMKRSRLKYLPSYLSNRNNLSNYSLKGSRVEVTDVLHFHCH